MHTSLSALGYVCGGALAVIKALLDSVGSEGTIMMPTQTWKNLDPAEGVYWQEPEEWWPVIRENIPAYDKRITPTNTMGAVSEMFRQWPGTLRSDHPARSVAAWGRYARADYPGKHTVIQSSAIQSGRRRIWKSYETLAVDGEDLPAIGEAFEKTGQVRHAQLGNGLLSMMNQRVLVDFAVEWISQNRK